MRRAERFPTSRLRPILMLALLASVSSPAGAAAPKPIPKSPPRAEGEGPFERLILRGVTLIDGTGAPAVGPMDVVVENNRIADIRSVGVPGVPIDAKRRPKAEPGDKEIDLEGHYLLPGFVDLHGHFGGDKQGTPAEYVAKLWMGHGITTVCDPGSGNGLEWTLEHKRKSECNEITAPRIQAYVFFGQGHEGSISTTQQARAWVAKVAAQGADGLKFFGARPDIMAAAISEAKTHGMRTTCHHAQLNVARMNVLDSARLGLTSMQHWYGLPEALFTDRVVQDYPHDYNYNDEQDRFGQAGRLWQQAAKPFSERWDEVMNELLALDFTIVPTFHAYEAARDLMRMRRAEWHEEYTLPSLWRWYAPNRVAHASYWFYWTTADEIAWKNNYRLWMAFINEYKNRGGRICVGTDSGYTYNLYGFSFVREMELLQEAGFHPLEVIRAATLGGAEVLGLADRIGTIEVGKLADLVVVDENPLVNLKVLYGTGALKLNDENQPVRVGGIKYTIKDGILYDARQLLADVRRIVREAKDEENFEITQPGLPPKRPRAVPVPQASSLPVVRQEHAGEEACGTVAGDTPTTKTALIHDHARTRGAPAEGWPTSSEVGNTNQAGFASPTAKAMGHPTHRRQRDAAFVRASWRRFFRRVPTALAELTAWRERLDRAAAALQAASRALPAEDDGDTPSDSDADPSRVTLERLYETSDFDGERVGDIQWLRTRPGYTTWEESEGPYDGKDLVRHDPATDTREILVPSGHLVPPGTTAPLKVESHAWSADEALLLIYTNSKRVWRRNTRGDYWVLDVSSRELRKLGGDAPPSTLMFAKFSPDGRRVAYVRANNIYVEDLRERSIWPVTTDGSDRIVNGTFDWVYEEELGLRDGIRWSPDSASIAYWQIDTAGVREFNLINNTDSLYPRLTPIKYPKVGEKNSACRVGVVRAAGGATRWMNVPGDPRNHYIARMDWADNPRELVVQQLNRLQNTNTVMLADAATGQVRRVFQDTDDAWVDVHDALEWLDDGQRFTWLSERDGWRHLYTVSRAGDDVQCATPGDYDVIDLVGIDAKEKAAYIYASPKNPTQRYLYRVPLDGGKAERITPADQDGTHRYNLSPDARWAIHTYSSINTPPITEIVSLPDHKRGCVLADNSELRDTLAALDRQPTELFRVDIGDGVLLDGWCIKPPDLDPEKRYPLLFYVYGEPAGQSVLDRWGGKRYLWHLMLAQQGYVVMCIDNRGTPAPRGRAWRKSVYRQVGILASADQAAALRAILETRPYLDPDRVGVWGWSGGGSMTLNMLFRYPDLYHTGMAVAPVPNQRLYDTIYQERYMGLPQDNVDGFKKGSPITYAHQLEGNLLLVHGTADDNVHYQGSEALINELIAHNKPFTMMSYPNRTHSIREGKNTRHHLFALLTRYLYQNLPAGELRIEN